MVSRLHAVLAGASVLSCALAMAAEQRIEIKTDPAGKHFVVERQGTADNPVLITKREAPDNTTRYMKRAFDCKNWKVRNLGAGPTRDAMNKGEPETESAAIEADSIPDHYARHACPPPHPGPR